MDFQMFCYGLNKVFITSQEERRGRAKLMQEAFGSCFPNCLKVFGFDDDVLWDQDLVLSFSESLNEGHLFVSVGGHFELFKQPLDLGCNQTVG